MAGRLYKRPQVLSDLEQHFVVIAEDNLAAAHRFLDTAEAALQRYAEWPYSGRAWQSPDPRLTDIRVGHLPRPFGNYLVFYRPVDDGIEVLTIQHGARELQSIIDWLEP